MTFEEDFPSIKNKGWIVDKKDRQNFQVKYNEDFVMFFSEFDLQRYCLDKQKVRDAFNRLLLFHEECPDDICIDKVELTRTIKELGL